MLLLFNDLEDFNIREEMKLFKTNLQSFVGSEAEVETFTVLAISIIKEPAFEVLVVYMPSSIKAILVFVTMASKCIEDTRELSIVKLKTVAVDIDSTQRGAKQQGSSIVELEAYYT